jgi:hypothetical protein
MLHFKIIKIMKAIIYYSLFFTIILISCEKFLNQFPLDQITSDSYWQTPKDLELYLNHFYTSFTTFPQNASTTIDGTSDNFVLAAFDARLAGTTVVPASGGGWTWTNVKSVNYFLSHYTTVKSPWVGISQYVGEAYFFRAYYYYGLVQAFGDLPWINKTLSTTSEELYMPQISRTIIVDSIIADLDKAISYMGSKGQAPVSRINKEVAMLFKSRVCLFEGTWEKYQAGTPFGVTGSDGKKYVTLARDAAKQLIDKGLYQLYSTGKPKEDYYHLFGLVDYSSNSEVLLWRGYNKALSLVHREAGTYYRANGWGLSKWLVDSYLCTDGLPISVSPLYAGDNNLLNVVKNRDPRLAQTIWIPRDPALQVGNDTTFFKITLIDLAGEYLCTSGYQVKKYSDCFGDGLKEAFAYEGDVGLILFRYGEALLNYAEARAELGEISQSDIDITINKLRDRVGLPHLQLNNIVTDPKWDYPTLSPIINEVRRERRVELALENLRIWDLLRWRAHALFVNKRPPGAKFIQADFPKMVIGKNIYLDKDGYIDFYFKALPSGYGFKPERDYLSPLSSLELTLNEKLIQNPGW